MTKQNNDLIAETGKALLEAIREAAPKASAMNMEPLANAYKAVVEAMPNQQPGGSRLDHPGDRPQIPPRGPVR